MDHLNHPGVRPDAQKRHDHPDQAFVEVIDLDCGKAEDVKQGNCRPESSPHLILDKPPVQFDHQQEASDHN